MFKKIFATLFGILVLAVSGFAGFAFLARPLVRPAPTVSAAATPERLARGEYLAWGCLDCHSKRDFTRYSGPPLAPFGAHAYCYDRGVGIPGRVCPPNITSDKETGLGSWTDGEIVRAIREGVSRDGRALFPLMPYEDFRRYSDEDTLAIVAFLRTLPAVAYKAPAPQLDFPVPVVIRFLPKPMEGSVEVPPRTDAKAYGQYLTSTLGCASCHTTTDARMAPIPGKEFAGNNEFSGPWGVARSANITPHPDGLGDKTKENFIGLFRAFGSVEDTVPKGAPNTIMAWALYNKLTDEDLGVIYDYLKMQKPVAGAVEKFPKSPKG